MRFLFVLFTQGKFCKNIIYLFKLLFCKEIPQGQKKIFLLSCTRWELVTYSLSCIQEQAVRGITLFFLLNPFSFSKTGIILISSHQQTYLLACKNLDISVCYHFPLEQKEIQGFSVPVRNKCTSTQEHEPADKTADRGRVLEGQAALDLTTVQLLSSTPGKSPVISSRENCLNIFM